jgi:putative DNA primase/helicase
MPDDFPPLIDIANAVQMTPDRIFVRSGAPYEVAQQFINLNFQSGETPLLRYHRGAFYVWSGASYPELLNDDLKARLYRFLADCWVRKPDGSAERLDPTPTIVGAVTSALEAAAHLPAEIASPSWLEQVPDIDPGDIIACANGLLHLPEMTLLGHTPIYFNYNALEFGYDPSAPLPTEWLRFLDQLWPSDQQSIDTLHEIYGYCLTTWTSLQKIFLLIGPRRSGKGTIGRILRCLLGRHNISAPTLGSLPTEFGLQPLIGKLAAIIGDARLGARVDHQAVVERLLSISGEDIINVNRKNLTHWIGQLICRFLIISNEIPKLGDPSGALASRMIILRLTHSFLGREDHGLFDRLLPELSGIFNLALAGWRRLRDRGYFIQPSSSIEMAGQLEDLSSPISQFVRERCELGPYYEVSRDALFKAWCNWCSGEGRHEPGIKSTFGRDLAAAFPEVGELRKGGRGEQERFYTGIKLKVLDAGSAIYTLCIRGIDFNHAPAQFNHP